MDGERVDAAFELTDKCFVDHAVALEPALPAERLRHNIHPEMSLPALASATPAGARNGFGEARDREPKSTLSHPQPAAETAYPVSEPAKMSANCGLFVRDRDLAGLEPQTRPLWRDAPAPRTPQWDIFDWPGQEERHAT